jgi:FtsP/CotA-like multicopper oxidase with cupredoxin domain
VSINLCAVAGTVAPLPTTAAGVTVPIWGFGVPTTPGACTTATASLPGPQLVVNEGDVVTLTITNALPAGTVAVPHTISLDIPGVSFTPLPGPTQAVVGATFSRTFTASAPGTYLYQSPGDFGRQEAMGLYGDLLVRSNTAGQAYDSATTAYDVEAPLVLSEIDPLFNAAPDTYDMHSYRATYWLINGKSYPDTAGITATPGQLRYVSAGYDNTTMSLLGLHEHVVARDSRLLNNPLDADAETIPAGATEDAIATMPSSAPPTTNGFPLFNRQLHLTNGAQTGTSPTPATGGGMLTFIHA